ncbi:MAG: radical SAM protein [Thermodesulfobacteriota bacterium]|nr:radical SAM protein [Thermodesulfobacteriota bacterium]
MKVSLISPYPDITAFGLRTISAYLKKNGHETQMIFLPDPYGDNPINNVARYDDQILEELIPLCKGSDLIGITLMTNFFDGAVQITKGLKKGIGVPVIWGGVHPTIRPFECLKYADMVCIGDGEDAILELADRIRNHDDILTVENIWIHKNGEIIKNPLRPLQEDLDIYPAPDFNLKGHYISFNGHIHTMSPELLKAYLKRGTVSKYLNKIGYQTMTGRGCPHKCTYCINDSIKDLYKGQRYLRWRSTPHVMKELLWVKKNLPHVGYIWISDDAFFAKSEESLRNFCNQYKDLIRLPFTCLASPITITEKKMELLVDAGLIYLQMGIESGSTRIQEMYNRKTMSNERILNAVEIIHRFKEKMYPPSYDFILDNPYETDDDKIESLRLISKIPKPFHLQPFSLVLSPGTRLYEMAKEDKHIVCERREVYTKTWSMRKESYFNMLMSLAKGGRLPSILLRFLISKGVIRILNSKPIMPTMRYALICVKKVYHFLKR